MFFMENNSDLENRTRNSSFQFSLRDLFGLVTTGAVSMGVISLLSHTPYDNGVLEREPVKGYVIALASGLLIYASSKNFFHKD